MLLVGCPVLLRDWALPSWFEHLDAALEIAAADDVEFVFVGGAWDTATWAAASAGAAGRPVHIVHVDEPRRTPERDWTGSRHQRMVDLRNVLLAETRRLGPAMFLSLDSDIDLHPDALADLLDTVSAGTHVAVGGACMLNGKHSANYYVRDRRGVYERPRQQPGVITVKVIAAVKLMTPVAYGIDYAYHHRGEDVGWSEAVIAAGHRLAWDSRVWSTHNYEGPS